MANGDKYLRLWKDTRGYGLKRVPLPVWVALEILKGRMKAKSIEDVILTVIKRDPEAREIIRFVLEGRTPVRLKSDPTIEEEIASED